MLLAGLSLVFSKFFQVFKSTHFLVHFKFKVKFNVKTVLNNKKTLKIYYKVTLNVFRNKKIFDVGKKIIII